MTVIAGTRRSMKELADGTIRVQIDIDPQFKNEFMAAFSAIDMPVAIAPLVADFERNEDCAKQSAQAMMVNNDKKFSYKTDEMIGSQIHLEADKPKGGQLAKLAGMWCAEPSFWDWLNTSNKWLLTENALDAKYFIYDTCKIDSRAELDNNPEAAEKFHNLIRIPYSEYLKSHD